MISNILRNQIALENLELRKESIEDQRLQRQLNNAISLGERKVKTAKTIGGISKNTNDLDILNETIAKFDDLKTGYKPFDEAIDAEKSLVQLKINNINTANEITDKTASLVENVTSEGGLEFLSNFTKNVTNNNSVMSQIGVNQALKKMQQAQNKINTLAGLRQIIGDDPDTPQLEMKEDFTKSQRAYVTDVVQPMYNTAVESGDYQKVSELLLNTPKQLYDIKFAEAESMGEFNQKQVEQYEEELENRRNTIAQKVVSLQKSALDRVDLEFSRTDGTPMINDLKSNLVRIGSIGTDKTDLESLPVDFYLNQVEQNINQMFGVLTGDNKNPMIDELPSLIEDNKPRRRLLQLPIADELQGVMNPKNIKEVDNFLNTYIVDETGNLRDTFLNEVRSGRTGLLQPLQNLLDIRNLLIEGAIDKVFKSESLVPTDEPIEDRDEVKFNFDVGT